MYKLGEGMEEERDANIEEVKEGSGSVMHHVMEL